MERALCQNLPALATPHPFSLRAGVGQVHLRVLETTDLHVHIHPWDYYTDRPSDAIGLAHTATLIAQLRDEADNSLLFDNGDFLQGNPMGDYIAFQHGLKAGDLHPVIAAMNAVGYDAATLGNHEFNYGLEFLTRAVAGARFPVVSANVATRLGAAPRDDRTLLPPYVLLDRQVRDGSGQEHRLRIGVIGFVTPQIVRWDYMHLEGRIDTRDIAPAAASWVAEMKEAGADLVLALAHTGIGEAEGAAGQENAAVPLGRVEGIDALLTGHSHLLFPSPRFEGMPGVDIRRGTVSGKPTVMSGFWGSHLGVIDLMLENDGAGWQVLAHQSQARPVRPDGRGASHAVTEIAREGRGNWSGAALPDSAPPLLDAAGGRLGDAGEPPAVRSGGALFAPPSLPALKGMPQPLWGTAGSAAPSGAMPLDGVVPAAAMPARHIRAGSGDAAAGAGDAAGAGPDRTAAGGRGGQAQEQQAAAAVGDPGVLSAVSRAHAGTLAYMRRPVSRSRCPIQSYFALLPADVSLAIVAAAQSWHLGRRLEDSAMAGLPILSAVAPFKAGGRGGPNFYTDIPAGEIALRHIADLYIYPNLIRALRVTGADIREWLERSASIFARLAPGKPNQMLLDAAFASYSFDVIYGLSYQIDPRQPARYDPWGGIADPGAARVGPILHDGQPIDPEAEFIVATNSYRVGGTDFGNRRPMQLVHEGTETSRDILLRYVSETGEIAPPADPVWRFVEMDGISAVFETGPGALPHLGALDRFRPESLGVGADGFLRLRLHF